MKNFAMLAILVAGCNGEEDTFRITDGDERTDETPPRFTHEHDSSPRTAGEPVEIMTTVDDASMIEGVFLYYQRETDGADWKSVTMDLTVTETDPEENLPNFIGEAVGVIPGSDIGSAGMRYYLVAEDELGNESCEPSACANGPYYFPVVPPRN